MKKYKKLAAVILVLLVVGGAVVAWRHFSSNTNAQGSNPATNNGINYSPPTKQEQQVGDREKNQVIQTQNQDKKPQNPSVNSNVTITDAAQYGDTIEVRSFLPEVYKDGTCTIAFTQGSLHVIKEAPAYTDATTTICTNPLIKRTEFASTGTWQLIVSYKSSDGTVSGQSAPKNVIVK